MSDRRLSSRSSKGFWAISVWRELDRAAKESGIEHIGTQSFRHSYRMWIDAIGTPIGVQQKLMRHSDIRTTINIYGDAVTADTESMNVSLRPGAAMSSADRIIPDSVSHNSHPFQCGGYDSCSDGFLDGVR